MNKGLSANLSDSSRHAGCWPGRASHVARGEAEFSALGVSSTPCGNDRWLKRPQLRGGRAVISGRPGNGIQTWPQALTFRSYYPSTPHCSFSRRNITDSRSPSQDGRPAIRIHLSRIRRRITTPASAAMRRCASDFTRHILAAIARSRNWRPGTTIRRRPAYPETSPISAHGTSAPGNMRVNDARILRDQDTTGTSYATLHRTVSLPGSPVPG